MTRDEYLALSIDGKLKFWFDMPPGTTLDNTWGIDGWDEFVREVCRLAFDHVVHLRTILAKRDDEIAKLKEATADGKPHLDVEMRAGAKPVVEHVSPDSPMADAVARSIHEGSMTAHAKYGIQPGDDLAAIKDKIRRR